MLWGVWPPEAWPRVELFRTKFHDRLSYPTAVLVFHIGGSFMIVGVPRESFPGERRVALVPAVIPNLSQAGLDVVVEAGAGAASGYPDAHYAAKRPKIVPARACLF